MTRARKEGGSYTSSKVLVADDDVDILSLVTRYLRSLGVEVREANDGEEALRIARAELPSLVILDVMMPGKSGWEVCREMRSDPDLKKTPVLMLTGIGEKLNEMTSPLYGANAFIDKPFDLKDLDAKVRELLDVAKAE